jgi:large subunit ribosomal protein L22
MEVKASVKNIRIAPEKVNLLVAQVKRMSPTHSVEVLKLVNKSASPVLIKLIKSALANAKNNNGIQESDLIFKEIIVTKGPMFKRYQPVSRGRAHHIMKRTSHISVTLETKPVKQPPAEKKIEKIEQEPKLKVKTQKSK